MALAYINLVLAVLGSFCTIWAHLDNSFLRTVPDHPKNWMTQDEAVNLFDIVPVLLATDMTFMFTYNMMDGPIPVQSCHMDLRLGGGQVNGVRTIVFFFLP